MSKYPQSEHLGRVAGPDGRLYSQHFYGEDEGAAVITGPSPIAGLMGRLYEVPELYREPAESADDAREKLRLWRRANGWN